MVFWQKQQGFIKRPRYVQYIRAELIAQYLWVKEETVKEQMCRLRLSLHNLDDCIYYLELKKKQKIERRTVQKLADVE